MSDQVGVVGMVGDNGYGPAREFLCVPPAEQVHQAVGLAGSQHRHAPLFVGVADGPLHPERRRHLGQGQRQLLP